MPPHQVTGRSGTSSHAPALLFPNDETLSPELRGIGVRIEDDLVVTSTGADVLSDALPIEADDVAAGVRKQRS